MGVTKYDELGIFLFFSFFFLISWDAAAFTPADNYLIDCGSSSNTTINGRTFLSDSSLPSSVTVTTPKLVFLNASSSSSPLYRTARVLPGSSSYSFEIRTPGRHFVRLHFFPFSAASGSYNLTSAAFSVSTQDVPLLDNYQPSTSPAMKEFSLNITRTTLVLSFVPSSSGSNGIAFVNALEVVSVPDSLIADEAQTVSPKGSYTGLSELPLETAYRINMGGPMVDPSNDTLSRTWIPDQSFLLDQKLSRSVAYTGAVKYMQGGATRDTAPDAVYGTCTELATSSSTANAQFNVTWQFDVDPSSSYLVRMHFCDIVSKAAYDLLFNVYVGTSFAAQDLDLSTRTIGSLATAYYMDFVTGATDPSGKLSVSIGPSAQTNSMPDGILNGLEIMRMNSSGSVSVVTPDGQKAKLGVVVGAVLGAVAAAVIAVVLVLWMRRKKRTSKSHSKIWLPFSINGTTTTHSVGSRVSNGTVATTGPNGSFGYQFSFAVVQEATNNFDENWVIGVGGFGKVYKGVMRDDTQVAVKRGNPKSQQGINEFRTEIDLLSRLRHRHLVSLIGYCDERNEMILVYEYMEKGTLKSHLYGSNFPNLTWKQRLEVCIGAARGLHYLHTGSTKAVIHRDVKSANILLDENLMAKVADFGLSKTGPELDQTHVSTAVKGSFGYLDPEYFRRQQLTEKSDVYSFGVVLLEVLCARPVIDPTLAREMVNLAEWAMKWQMRGELDQIVDSRLRGNIQTESLRKYGETVEKCLADYGVDRPSMGDVLWNLEYALQLQQAESDASEVNSINSIPGLSLQVQNMVAVVESPADRGQGSVVGSSDTDDLSEVSMSRVFSQLIKSEGR
ncbi:receptor-like protein kinase HERK 1 [Iris pallida]|uniref:Receptor-like protein kinase HERK 1 n=1 Tax=Iris pallida TaxID=29817 RepID=A0AAX6GHE7_IRIPA|nr:receptor-like protein kinase HERK 1 [Iris pallida]